MVTRPLSCTPAARIRNKFIPHIIIVLVGSRGENQRRQYQLCFCLFFVCTILLYLLHSTLTRKCVQPYVQFKTVATIDKAVLTYPFVKILYYTIITYTVRVRHYIKQYCHFYRFHKSKHCP